MRHSFSFLARSFLVALGFTGLALAQSPSPGDATWHIAVSGVMPNGSDLDIYPIFKDGAFHRALATSRRYNTSIHFVESSDLLLENGNRFTGSLTFRVTPDRWVPSSGQSALLTLSFGGRTEASGDGNALLVRGTYTGSYDDREVTGTLGGGVGETESNWERKVLRARVTPVILGFCL